MKKLMDLLMILSLPFISSVIFPQNDNKNSVQINKVVLKEIGDSVKVKQLMNRNQFLLEKRHEAYILLADNGMDDKVKIRKTEERNFFLDQKRHQ